MGGAVALLLHKKDPNFWHGAVLVAPMCKVKQKNPISFSLIAAKKLNQWSFYLMYENDQISEKVKPHPVVVNILTRVEEIIPKWKIVPSKDVIDSAFKDPVKREEVMISVFQLLVLYVSLIYSQHHFFLS